MSVMGFVTYLLETMCQGNQKPLLILILVFFFNNIKNKTYIYFLSSQKPTTFFTSKNRKSQGFNKV